MKIIKVFFIFLLIVTISIVGIISYWKIEESLINKGFYNIYSYEMNDELAKEINSYMNSDYFINIEERKLLNPISYKKYPLLESIFFYGEKTQDGFLLKLISNNVSEYLYYCNICNFENYYYYEGGHSENIMKKEFGANIVEINDNTYHIYYNPILNF